MKIEENKRRPGRPPIEADKRSDKGQNVYLTADELLILDQEAKEKRMSRAAVLKRGWLASRENG